ncbi:MAG: helix-turn-helix transcriptional regulator [Verrucomicrobia bacterium]|nr:helix-turn-helix transcriptional regulator [Verrucomicrobiota bacterium]
MTDIYKHISQTLKALRKERGWSLDRAAQETGVSKAMLGQIEREESSPTIATLWKIAGGFNAPFSTFITDLRADAAVSIHSSGKTKAVHPADAKLKVFPLFPYDETLHLEIFLIELLAGCEHMSSPHKPGVIEHVIVVLGSMEVLVDGTWKTLHQGEGLRFSASQPHGYRNRTEDVAVIHDIIHYGSMYS